jgi:DNA invertase Pin-like site-specific DNA recombinase
MARLAEYLRRSSVGEEDRNYSIENQHDDITHWNASSGHTVVRTYSDPGGKSDTLNRPIFQRMMADAKAGLFDTLVVGRWDRFSRNQDQQAVAIYQLQGYSMKVISATQPTPEGPIGTLIRNNYAFAAELELYSIRERTTAGKKKRVQRGLLHPMSYPRYGYLFADETKGSYIPDPQTAWVVRLIFDLVLSGMTLRSIAHRLDEEGIPTPLRVLEERGQLPKNRIPGDKWDRSSLKVILRHPAYVGKLRGWQITTTEVEEIHPISGEIIVRRKQIRRADDDPDVVVFSAEVCPPLVDQQTFDAVQMLLTRNQKEASRNLRYPEALLLRGGFGLCGYCGCKLKGMWSKRDQRYRYFCSSLGYKPCEGHKFSWRAEELDDLTWRWVMHQFENPDVLRRKFEQWKADQVEGKAVEYDRLGTLEKLIAKATKRKQNCMASAADAQDEETRLEFTHMAEEQSRQIRKWAQEQEQLTKVIGQVEQFNERVENIVALGQQAKQHLEAATFDDKRVTLLAFDVQVRTWRHDHEPPFDISWGFDRLHEAWVQSKRFLGREGPQYCVDAHKLLHWPYKTRQQAAPSQET